MAEDSTNHISYFLSIGANHADYLGNIRIWDNLKMATEGKEIWVTGFSEHQLESIEVQSIPYKSIFYAQNGKLFKLGSLLPSRNQPALLWTPIARAIPVTLPDFNHNYFGLADKVSIQLIRSELEQKANALLTSIASLRTYVEQAPTVRLKPLKWVLIDQDQALVLGKPLLPIQGKAFWQKLDFLIPLGYDFDLHLLAPDFNHILNPNQQNLLLLTHDLTYSTIAKDSFQALSISSFRKTITNHST